MTDPDILQRLSSGVQPGDAAKNRIKARVQARIVSPISALAAQVHPEAAQALRVRSRILQTIKESSLAYGLPALARLKQLSTERQLALKQRILQRLGFQQMSLLGSALRWTAAFAVFLMLIRVMPLVLLAPPTQAETGVQLNPQGDVSVSIGGVWVPLTGTEVLHSPGLVRTGNNSQVTIVLNDDGVIRLDANTTIRLHDLTDRPQAILDGPTVTLMKGRIWVLGLLPPVFDGLSVETSAGMLSLNAASVSVEEKGNGSVVAEVFDRGIAFTSGSDKVFLISGERAITGSGGPLKPQVMNKQQFTTPWVTSNLDQDAVHRREIAELQQERRDQLAGILPDSILYPVKRVAEEVDVLFTLGEDAKAQKRVQQADTRLNEALALLHNGDEQQANEQLKEYRENLLALASGSGDNLVKFLVKKQIEEASTSVAVATPDDELYSLKQAVLDVSSALPDTNLKPQDIQGYVLVDKLTALNQSLSASRDLTGALLAYQEIQPYLQALLASGSGAHPLLQKEATSLLTTTSSLLQKIAQADTDTVAPVEEDIAQYLPSEPAEKERVLVTEEALNQRVAEMVERIFLFKMPRSRYNQLLAEMRDLVGDPNRGTLLRRLYHALPENGLAGYVETEIQKLGDELRGEGK